MAGGRRLPLLGEVGPASGGDDRPWSLRRGDLERLEEIRRKLDGNPAILITGAAPERSRLLATALAGASCAAGVRTALLECDLARPRIALDLGLAERPGVHEYLRWEATPEEIMQPLVAAGSAAATAEPLVCVAAGRQAPDPTVLLGLESFRHMAARLRGAYERLLVIGPPLADAAALAAVAAQADAVLVAVGPESSSRRARRSLRSDLRGLPAPALGAVAVAA